MLIKSKGILKTMTNKSQLYHSIIFILPFSLTACNWGDDHDGRIGNEFYVDCSQYKDGEGTSSEPINNIKSLNGVTLTSGDRVRFKKGSTCKGSVIAKYSGDKEEPIIYEDYGTDTKPPLIDANGSDQAFWIQDASWVTVQNLTLSAPGDGKQPRRGIWVTAEDSGERKGINLNNLEIKNVRGQMPSTVDNRWHGAGKYSNASGGIIVEAKGKSVPTWFNGLKIKNNNIYDVDRQGIYTWSNWCQRPELVSFWYTLCEAKWQPFENTIISNNRLSNIGGDGIAPMTTKNGRVDNNKLEGFNLRSQSPNAGMWSANSDDIMYQYNITSGGKTTVDGMAYDVDHSTNRITYQYNISYNNEGGFMLICPYGDPIKGRASDFVIRYNLSIGDKTRTFQVCSGGVNNGEIYNNTIMLPNSIANAHKILVENATKANVIDLSLSNNVFMQSNGGVEPIWETDDPSVIGTNNLYSNVPPMDNDSYYFTENPNLTQPGLQNYNWEGYVPLKNSVTIAQGTKIENSVQYDALKRVISSPPTIGALEPEG